MGKSKSQNFEVAIDKGDVRIVVSKLWAKFKVAVLNLISIQKSKKLNRSRSHDWDQIVKRLSLMSETQYQEKVSVKYWAGLQHTYWSKRENQSFIGVMEGEDSERLLRRKLVAENSEGEIGNQLFWELTRIGY